MSPRGSCVLYGRISTGESKRRLTLDEQRRVLREEAERQGYEVVGEFFEPLNTKGDTPLGQRAEGQKMLALLRAGGVDAVLVCYIDRFGRTLLDGLQTAKMLEGMGVGIISITEGINTLDPHADPINLQIRLMFAEMEHRRIKERLANGKARAARDFPNRPLGCAVPFGYRVNEQGEYVIHEVEGYIVQEIFARVYRGEPIKQVFAWVVQYATAHGVQPGRRHQRRGAADASIAENNRSGRWHLTWMSKRLRNPVYLGTKSYGDYVFTVPPLVTQEVWDGVQARLREHRGERVSKGGPESGFLSGLLTCGLCGSKFYHWVYQARGRKKRYYMCDSMRRRDGCRAKLLPVEEVDAEVWLYIEDLLRHPDQMLARLSSAAGEAGAQVVDADRQEAALLESLAAVERQVEAVWREAEAQGWDLRDVAPHINRLRRRREEVEAELEGLRKARATRRQRLEELHETTSYLSEIRAKLDQGLTREEKHAVVRRMVVGGTVETLGAGRQKDYRLTLRMQWELGDGAGAVHTPSFPNSAVWEIIGIPRVGRPFAWEHRQAAAS